MKYTDYQKRIKENAAQLKVELNDNQRKYEEFNIHINDKFRLRDKEALNTYFDSQAKYELDQLLYVFGKVLKVDSIMLEQDGSIKYAGPLYQINDVGLTKIEDYKEYPQDACTPHGVCDRTRFADLLSIAGATTKWFSEVDGFGLIPKSSRDKS